MHRGQAAAFLVCRGASALPSAPPAPTQSPSALRIARRGRRRKKGDCTGLQIRRMCCPACMESRGIQWNGWSGTEWNRVQGLRAAGAARRLRAVAARRRCGAKAGRRRDRRPVVAPAPAPPACQAGPSLAGGDHSLPRLPEP
eukprot:gene15907-biopygen3709